MRFLTRLFKREIETAPPECHVPEGMRVYAIGDVHGRLDLLDALLARIDGDDAARTPAETRILLLGDLIDRGPDSRGVVERVMERVRHDPRIRCLSGNHEELLVKLWRGEASLAPTFHRAGGRETLLSYGVDPEIYDGWTFNELAEGVRAIVPEAHVAFLAELGSGMAIGDYYFVHAGIRPGIPIARQRISDLRWIREEFTRSTVMHDAMIVHGHSPRAAVDVQPNRIGIDTGAYATGILTALALQRNERWFLATPAANSGV